MIEIARHLFIKNSKEFFELQNKDADLFNELQTIIKKSNDNNFPLYLLYVHSNYYYPGYYRIVSREEWLFEIEHIIAIKKKELESLETKFLEVT